MDLMVRVTQSRIFLQSLKDEYIEKPSQSLKNLSAHTENNTTKLTFKDQPLVGWKIICCHENVDTC
jgi:hypothetical protein